MARLGPAFDAVLGAAQQGEPWAFQRLFDSVAGSLAGYLRAHGAADVDGVANEVLLSAFRGIGRFDGGEEAFRSWLFTIAHRRLVDERRQRSRQVAQAPLETGEPSGAALAGGDAEADALARLDEARIVALVAGLTDDQRDVLLLRFVADLSVEETGRLLRKPVTAVKALQRRGLERLRREMSAEVVSG